MNIRQMEVFWAVMRTGSVTGAARLLGVSQPAVSKVLKHAEDVIGIALFRREGGKLHPTREAEEIFAVAESVFENVDQLNRAVEDIRRGGIGRLQVAAQPSVATTFLPAPITSFLRRRPNTNFTMKMLTSYEIVLRIVRNQVDLGVLYGPLPEAGLDYEDIAALEVMCGVHVASPLAQEPTLTPELLASERLISFAASSPWVARTVSAFEDAHVPYQIAVECSHPTIALSLVESGFGIALLPAMSSDARHFPNVRLRPFSPCISIRLLGVYRQERLSRLGETFLGEVKASLASERPEAIAETASAQASRS